MNTYVQKVETRWSPFEVLGSGSASSPNIDLNTLSPEGMIAYVQEMLGATDGQINQMTTSMKTRKDEAAWLQQVAARMRKLKDGKMQGELSGLEKIRSDVQAKADTGDPEAKKALDLLNGMITSLAQNKNTQDGNDMGAADNDWLENKTSTIDAQVSELTSSTELDMIQLQTLVEQRSHIIAFASKVIASLDDNTKNIIGNMR